MTGAARTVLKVLRFTMQRLLLAAALAVVFCADWARAGEEKAIKVLLIAKERDHAFSQHEYMSDCTVLAKCLKQTHGVQAEVSNGWPRDPDKLKGVKALVFNTRMGGSVLFDPLVKAQANRLLKEGVGLTAIHWGTGAEKDAGEAWLNALGGWFNADLFSKYMVRTIRLKQAEPKHPICFGWTEYDLREEYYIKLKFLPGAKPILSARIDKEEYPVAWVYDRPDGGRSFGFLGGHFHDNFGLKDFRRAIVNGILWTARVEVPADGAPVTITAKDMELPPDTRKKK
jgi:type 1 glutamine amidotransferase